MVRSAHVQAPGDHPTEIPRPGERPRVSAGGGLHLSVRALPADTGMPAGPADSGGQAQVQTDYPDPEQPGQPGAPRHHQEDLAGRLRPWRHREASLRRRHPGHPAGTEEHPAVGKGEVRRFAAVTQTAGFLRHADEEGPPCSKSRPRAL